MTGARQGREEGRRRQREATVATAEAQILASDVMYRMSEYATMKALGYGDATLSRVVISQAVILALMGFLPSWFIAIGLYAVTMYPPPPQLLLVTRRLTPYSVRIIVP